MGVTTTVSGLSGSGGGLLASTGSVDRGEIADIGAKLAINIKAKKHPKIIFDLCFKLNLLL